MTRNTIKKAVCGLAAVAAAAAIAPAGASAATVAVSGSDLNYTAGTGKTNNLRVTMSSTSVTFMENNSDQPASVSSKCTHYQWGVVCPLSGIARVQVYAGDLHDLVVAELNGTTAFNLRGGSGNDYLDLAGSVDNRGFLYGEDGDDQLYGRQFGDTAYGGYGNDTIGLGGGNDTAVGESGNDRIDTGAGNDHVYAKDGSMGDNVACGDGSDWAQIDRNWYMRDTTSACETLAS